MGSRLPPMLKDAGLTAFVAAALGIFVVVSAPSIRDVG